MSEMASKYKVAYHRRELEAYLRGEPIFPPSMELDITTACNRECEGCPSSKSPHSSVLAMGLVERIFARLEGRTRGLVLSGGEPTIASTFPDVLRLARQYGFWEVAVVTNGTRLQETAVLDALLEHGSAIRLSLYDWNARSLAGLAPTLQRMEALRSLIEDQGSGLQIGISALTCRENVPVLADVARAVASAGAHWLYFHPVCTDWDVGAPRLTDQGEALVTIEAIQANPPDGLRVFVLRDRYICSPIEFHGYHAAHFLLVVGADGLNYLATEVKYHRQYVIADLANGWRDDFLWQESRLERIRSVNSESYGATSRHRSLLYNDYIEGLVRAGQGAADQPLNLSQGPFLFPYIL